MRDVKMLRANHLGKRATGRPRLASGPLALICGRRDGVARLDDRRGSLFELGARIGAIRPLAGSATIAAVVSSVLERLNNARRQRDDALPQNSTRLPSSLTTVSGLIRDMVG